MKTRRHNTFRWGATLATFLASVAPASAEKAILPDGVVITPQLERLMADSDAMSVVEKLQALMARVGRPDGLVLETLAEDRAAELDARATKLLDDFMEVDINGDDKIGRLELSRGRPDWSVAQHTAFFRFYDTDENGSASRAEILDAIRLQETEVDSTALLMDLESWDLDADGTVTTDELQRVVVAYFLSRSDG